MAELPRRLADRLHKSAENIWVKFNAYAREYAQVNLGQGQPDYAPAEYIQKTLAEVAMEGNTYLQYTREQGHPRLVKAIASLHGPLLKRTIDAMDEVLVTHGAYGCLAACFLSLVNPGDEVILIEPCYDSYEPMTRVAEGVPVFVPLRLSVECPTKSSDWILDGEELEKKFSDRTKLILLNTPNNPLGKVYTREELEMISALCIKYDVICVSDEVYEWLVYPGMEHTRIATLPGMWERTITISSASKSLSVTGWRVGWSIGPKQLIDCLMIAHQNGDCVCTTPAQEAVARCIETEIPRLHEADCFFTQQMKSLQCKRDSLVQLVQEVGFKACVPDAGYFVLVDWSAIATREMVEDGSADPPDFQFALWLLKNHKIASIPPSCFYWEHKAMASKYVRFCFFKTEQLLEKAKEAFSALKPV